MTLTKELTQALGLHPDEGPRSDWIFEHHHWVLTNERLVMLSFYRLTEHPHHEVLWEQALESMHNVEVQQGTPVREDDTQPTMTNVAAGSGGGFGIAQTNPGPKVFAPMVTHLVPGNSYVIVDNLEVFRGALDEATRISDDIQKAIIYRERGLRQTTPKVLVSVA